MPSWSARETCLRQHSRMRHQRRPSRCSSSMQHWRSSTAWLDTPWRYVRVRGEGEGLRWEYRSTSEHGAVKCCFFSCRRCIRLPFCPPMHTHATSHPPPPPQPPPPLTKQTQVYERAIPAVPKSERMSVVELYVSRATDFFGVAKVGCVLVGGCCWGPFLGAVGGRT